MDESYVLRTALLQKSIRQNVLLNQKDLTPILFTKNLLEQATCSLLVKLLWGSVSILRQSITQDLYAQAKERSIVESYDSNT